MVIRQAVTAALSKRPSENLAAFLHTEEEKWKKVIALAGVKIN
jgi:hypothetical protein